MLPPHPPARRRKSAQPIRVARPAKSKAAAKPAPLRSRPSLRVLGREAVVSRVIAARLEGCRIC